MATPREVPKCRTCKGTSSLWMLVNVSQNHMAYACPGHLHALMVAEANGGSLHVEQVPARAREAVVT